jgi:hypothetical protein
MSSAATGPPEVEQFHLVPVNPAMVQVWLLSLLVSDEIKMADVLVHPDKYCVSLYCYW